MQAFGEGPDITPAFLVDNFPWDSLGTGTVVDMGGSNGSVSMAIAQAHPALKLIVQDRPDVIEAAKESELPKDLIGKVEFMAHDFFTEQPVEADVYLFRYIFHNWPDAYAVKILRQLVPVLRPGVRVVVNDHLLPEPNTASLTTEREVR
jgi:SAM-dependent methyltransferase